jgi:hypothetical protein
VEKREIMTEVTIVDFGWDAENLVAIYLSDDLFLLGDRYHDNINGVTKGFVKGLSLSNLVNNHFKINCFRLNSDFCTDVLDGSEVPETLEECRIKFSKDWEQVSSETWN